MTRRRGSSRPISSIDPVWPGSLGLESLLQLLKLMAANRWGAGAGTVFESPVIGRSHRWTYRGQIVPTDHRVTVQAEIKARDDRLRRLVADGHLEVDGKIIYQMHDFAIGLSAELATCTSRKTRLACRQACWHLSQLHEVFEGLHRCDRL